MKISKSQPCGGSISRDEDSCSVNLKKDPFTYPQLVKIRHLLGYTELKYKNEYHFVDLRI